MADQKAQVAGERIRVQFDMSPIDVAQLDQLRQDMDISSRAAVVREALQIFLWIRKKRKEGAIIVAVLSDGNQELPIQLL